MARSSAVLTVLYPPPVALVVAVNEWTRDRVMGAWERDSVRFVVLTIY